MINVLTKEGVQKWSPKLTLVVTDSLSLSAGCNLFQKDVALYSKDLWPLVVRKSGILSISESLVVLVEQGGRCHTNFDVKYAGAHSLRPQM